MRLDRQRKPHGRIHVRYNSRQYRRGYKVLPHNVWGDDPKSAGPAGGANPTGAVPGNPGAFTPAGCKVPTNLAQLSALGALGQTTKWPVSTYVNLDPSGSAYWNGTAWALGVSP
jgi:hypothetical protein